ncbi:MAG: hypothetical protein DWB99_06145 [Candidatus Poseidoniales archaeon]|nr:MAG: hypothetical protein DWB99_06145 [Candidatus Poseidoniales archaeon]
MQVAKSMSEDNDDSTTILEMIMNPNKTLANWFVSFGLLGLFLAVLNLVGCIHPSYRVSWGGVFTLEATNKAFGSLDDAAAFVPSDAVFMAICAGLVFLGFKTINQQDGGVVAWFKSIFVNETWPALADPSVGGWSRLAGAWCLLLGVVNYLYFGLNSIGWIDPGVYSVTIALLSFGLALNYFSFAPEGDENLD